jgi:hypothetical protein
VPSCDVTTWATILLAAGVPRTSLVWPSNCGSGRLTVSTAVSPSIASSLMMSPSLTLSALVDRIAVLSALVSPRSKPATWVPPCGVATTLTNERTVVS